MKSAWLISLILLTCPAATSGQIQLDVPNFSKAEVDGLIAQLDDDGTRLEAMAELIDYAYLFLYESGSVRWIVDQETDDRRRRAADAVHAQANLETIGLALESDDHDLRYWGVMRFETSRGKTRPWEPLVDRLIDLADNDPSAGLRSEAIRKLRSYEKGRDFLKSQLEAPTESDPSVLMRLFAFNMDHPTSRFKGGRSRYYQAAVHFLSLPDTRQSWLSYIRGNVCNRATAEMWLIEEDPGLVSAIEKIAESKSPTERERKDTESILEYFEKRRVEGWDPPG